MLDLKPYLATHSLYQVHQQRRISIINLPAEILDTVLFIVYHDAGNQVASIMPASRVCRRFRNSAVPLMFQQTSCVLRENDHDRPRRVHTENLDMPFILRHVKTLSIRKALRTNDNDEANATPPEQLQEFRCHDLKSMQDDIVRMPNLQLNLAAHHSNPVVYASEPVVQLPFSAITSDFSDLLLTARVRCSLASAVAILSILKERPEVVIHFDYTFSYAGPSLSRKLVGEFKHLLNHRTVGLGMFYIPYDLSDSEEPEIAPQISAVRAIAINVDRINHPELASNSFIPGLNSQPFPVALSALLELWLTLNAKYLTPQIGWSELAPIIPWEQLRRLSLHGPTVQLRLHSILPQLGSLRSLRLRAEKLLPFHHNCPYAKNAIYSDVNHPYLELDFAFFPHLTSLSIEGICNHVPIQNLVAPSLRALKLHRPALRVSVFASESQRSPADLLKLARIAPDLERLELDISFIENLWHPTAIPGVDVDTHIYRFLAALANFKNLRFVRIFPPYVSRQSISRIVLTAPEYRQPCSDAQAIRLFNHIRNQNPKLAFFSISPSTRLRFSVLPSQAMTWEIRPWGEKTLLKTRQMGQEYELRQLWVGNRKLSSEVKRDSYHKSLSEDDEEGWILNYP